MSISHPLFKCGDFVVGGFEGEEEVFDAKVVDIHLFEGVDGFIESDSDEGETGKTDMEGVLCVTDWLWLGGRVKGGATGSQEEKQCKGGKGCFHCLILFAQ